MSKKNRKRPGKAVRRALAAFYEGDADAAPRCLVTGAYDNVEYHHIDEDSSNSKDPHNLLPLDSKLNSKIENRHRRFLEPELTEHNLESRARHYYARGNFAKGYGCSVLGLSLTTTKPKKSKLPLERHIKPNWAGVFAAGALVNLRPINRPKVAADALSKIFIPLLHEWGFKIELPTRAGLAMELGSYFRDAGKLVRASDSIELSKHSLRFAVASETVDTLLARLAQHEAIVAVFAGHPEKARALFEKADQLVNADYVIGHANEALYEIRLQLARDKPDFEIIAELQKRFRIDSQEMGNELLMSRWTFLERIAQDAQAARRKGGKANRNKANRLVNRWIKQVRKTGIVPSAFYAYADQFPSEKRLIVVQSRSLPKQFVTAASTIESLLKNLDGFPLGSHGDPS